MQNATVLYCTVYVAQNRHKRWNSWIRQLTLRFYRIRGLMVSWATCSYSRRLCSRCGRAYLDYTHDRRDSEVAAKARRSWITRWFKYGRDWFVCKQAALHSCCAVHLVYTQISPGHIWATLYYFSLCERIIVTYNNYRVKTIFWGI